MVAAARQRRLRSIARQGRVSELIGRTAYTANIKLYNSRKSVDETIPDYEFYDKLRRCKASGYRLGGLFAKRIERVIASWVLGGGLEIKLRDGDLPEAAKDYTNAAIAEFIAGLLDSGQDSIEEDQDTDTQSESLLMSVFKDMLGLGDQYIIINADGTLSIPSPDTVEMKRDEQDYRRILSLTVTTNLDKYVITDEYRADGRTVTVKAADRTTVQEFQNLIGRIPVIHLANGRSGNEIYGHPIHEELLKLYDQYDDTVFKQLDGAKLLGNPLLAFVGMKDIKAVQNANQPASNNTYLDKDGNEVEQPQLNIDANAVLLVGEGGDAKFVAPPTGFTEDTKTALKTLFLLLLDHTGIPEFVWGNELSSAHASAEIQMDQFVKDIQGWQRDNGGWIIRLVKIWLQFKALVDPQIIVDTLVLSWPPLQKEDKELQLKQVEYARGDGLLTGESALTLLDLVEDPETEFKDAQAEQKARQDAMFPDGTSQAFQNQLNQDTGNQPNDQVQQMEEWRPETTVHEYAFLLDAVRELRNALLEVAA